MKKNKLGLIYAVTIAIFADAGVNAFAQGAISDQTLLLQNIVDGLGVYNSVPDPDILAMSDLTIRQDSRISQAPKAFGKHADGGSQLSSRNVYRIITTPLVSYDLSSDFTVEWLQDALDSDVRNELEAAILGDVELVEAAAHYAMFTKRTAGAVGTAYQASFYNGETDVPRYKNNIFSAAHYHYLGANSTTLTDAIWDGMIQDIREHGFGTREGALTCRINSADVDEIFRLTNNSSNIIQAFTEMRARSIDRGVQNGQTPGVMVKGVWVKVDDNVPSGYLGMYANDIPVMLRREHFAEQYRGLMLFREGGVSPEFPLAGMRFMRRVGFAARQLGAATFRQLVASTTYTNPTFNHPAFS